ncbi:hypothetical protein [Candidatus Ruminimicrobium bovinum]|uniref:hypothetical protein n=1 Tax=Candidatus Ruminimicrobium bovinum TaxID=3242779 RepID=UPI0039B8E18E
MKCPICKEEIKNNSKFCSQCETKLDLSNQLNGDDFNYRDRFEFESLKKIDDITNLKISLANIEFILPILILTLKHMIIQDKNGEISIKNLYKQFMFSFIFLIRNSNFGKDIKEKIYKDIKIDKDIFEQIEYFIPTKKDFLSNSNKLLENMIVVMILLQKYEDNINSEILKQDYEKEVTSVLSDFCCNNFDDKVYRSNLIEKYKERDYYDVISILINFLASNGEVIVNYKAME